MRNSIYLVCPECLGCNNNGGCLEHDVLGDCIHGGLPLDHRIVSEWRPVSALDVAICDMCGRPMASGFMVEAGSDDTVEVNVKGIVRLPAFARTSPRWRLFSNQGVYTSAVGSHAALEPPMPGHRVDLFLDSRGEVYCFGDLGPAAA